MKNILKISLLLMLLFGSQLQAQNIAFNGSFTINGQTFNCRSRQAAYDPTMTEKSSDIINTTDDVPVPPSAYNSSTCTDAIRSAVMRQYKFHVNRANTLQLAVFLKTVFSPSRCAQLGDKYFSIDINVSPLNNNAVKAISYGTYSFGNDMGITQQEIAQLDSLIRGAVFTFPKATLACSNVLNIGIGGVDFKFNELYTSPFFLGIGGNFDN